MTAKSEGPSKQRNLDKLGMLDDKGGRHYVYPADVQGKWTRRKRRVYAVLIAVYLALPFVSIGGRQAILIDIPGRRFHLFGVAFNAQDFNLAFFVLIGIGFALIMASALYGRVWCGWACPQTVFLDGVFRRIERWIEGPASRRKKLAEGPWTTEKLLRKGAKHALYLVISFVIAHTFLAYFVGRERLFAMVGTAPGEHTTVFLWATALTATIYGNFWWFREQLCIVICPYGRLQSALQDDDTIIVGYDAGRGEPRGKLKDPNAGDCVNCGRCVAVCPTAIDIRNGLQLECIGCTACIDACDDVMTKVGRPTGLIRYDSLRGLKGEGKRLLRGRVVIYSVVALALFALAIFRFGHREPFEATVIRSQSTPFELTDRGVVNQLTIHVVNKGEQPRDVEIQPGEVPGVTFICPQPRFTLPPFGDHELPLVVEVSPEAYKPKMRVPVTISGGADTEPKRLELKVLGPFKVLSRKTRKGAPPKPSPATKAAPTPAGSTP